METKGTCDDRDFVIMWERNGDGMLFFGWCRKWVEVEGSCDDVGVKEYPCNITGWHYLSSSTLYLY